MAAKQEVLYPISDNMSSSPVLHLAGKAIIFQRKNTCEIEERAFLAALITLEGHFERMPAFGARTSPQTKRIIQNTLDYSLNRADVREHLAKNVDIWMRLRKIVLLAVPRLVSRSLRESYTEAGSPDGLDGPESASLILKNYDTLISNLGYLNNLLVISRNMLAIKETAQEICAAVNFDKAVHKLIIVCVNVTSKGYDGENVDDLSRGRLNEITELYKKVLVTCLQHTHNWTMGNDRFKMSFWFSMLFDNDLSNDMVHELPPDEFNVELAHTEVKHWLCRNNTPDSQATSILTKYSSDVSLGHTPGPLPEPLRQTKPRASDSSQEPSDTVTAPVWKAEMEDKYEQDRIYGRVSHEVDMWWKRVRDANYDGWLVPMETVEGAMARIEQCKDASLLRWPSRAQDPDYDHDESYGADPDDDVQNQGDFDNRSMVPEIGEDGDEEEDEEDDDSYVEGTLRGLLTEIPNILDTKQIEALHMTVKACVVDSMGSGLTSTGENLQKTRCKMFLALDCGKNLLREMLVFIAVWEQTDSQFIFQITAQIIESLHHNALLPYAWNSLKIMKDIVSPAQTVLLRLINYMFRARKESPIYDDTRDFNRDAKLVHYLYNYFRSRVVPDCVALIHAQAQIRRNQIHPSDFPVDLWDMERAKDGLSQYLDLISVVAEIPEMLPLLVEWEAIYELVVLLQALEEGIPKKPFDDPSMQSRSSEPTVEQTYNPPPDPNAQISPNTPQNGARPPPSLPPLHDTPHKFPWAGIKIQILMILTSLVAPSNKLRSGPGNPSVQKQLIQRHGVEAVLNCCSYDGHNQFLRERATLALRYIMEGCDEAQQVIRDLKPLKPPTSSDSPATASSSETFPPRRRQVALPGPDTVPDKSDKAKIEAIRNAQAALAEFSQNINDPTAQDLAIRIKQLQEVAGNEKDLVKANELSEKLLAQTAELRLR